MSETKPSNPKEAFGDSKMPLDLLPDTAVVMFNLAFLEGALKYGGYNYRVAGVKISTYVRAMRRHLSKFWNGQNADPKTLVHELASVGACAAVMLDAIACGKAVDDRPPRVNMEKVLDDAAKTGAHLKQLFKDHHPPQYTEREHGAQARGEPYTIGIPTHIEIPPIECHAEPGGCNGCREENERRAAYIGTGIKPPSVVPAGTRKPKKSANRRRPARRR